MASSRMAVVVAAVAFVTGAALAQGGPSSGNAPAPGNQGAAPGANAPPSGSGPMPGARGPAMGPGAGHEPGMRWGADVTPGWSMMTEQERTEHRDRMRSMNSHEECSAYMERHRQQMDERARERGNGPMAHPGRDACADLKR